MAFAFTKRDIASLGAALGVEAVKGSGTTITLPGGLVLEVLDSGTAVALNHRNVTLQLRNCLSYRTDATGGRALLLFDEGNLVTELRLTRDRGYSVTAGTTEQGAVERWRAPVQVEQAAGAVSQLLSTLQASKLQRTGCVRHCRYLHTERRFQQIKYKLS